MGTHEGDSTRPTLKARPDDTITPVAVLRSAIGQFVAERRWESFHTPKNLVMSLAIEAAELMETMQWLTAEESCAIKDDPKRLLAVGEEIADVFSYLLALCNVLKIDLTQTLLTKLEKNRLKYPVDQFRGRYGADDTRPPV